MSKIYPSLCIWRTRMLETMETSSIIMSFSSDSESLIWVFFWSDIAGRFSPASFGIANAVFIVFPSIFMAETPVGAINSTVGSSWLLVTCLNVFTTVWYINFVTWLFPDPPPPVRKRYIGSFHLVLKSAYFLLCFGTKIGANHMQHAA